MLNPRMATWSQSLMVACRDEAARIGKIIVSVKSHEKKGLRLT